MPADLHNSLQGVAGRHRAVRIGLATLQVLFVSLTVGLIAVLFLGEFVHMSLLLRWALALLVWAAPVGLCLHVLLPSLRRVNLRAAADTMDAATPQSQELFLSAVEFAQEQQHQFLGSPELVNHVINRAADDAHNVDPGHAVSAAKLLRWSLFCAPLLLTWAILWPLMPQTFTLGAQRTIFPWLALTAPQTSGGQHAAIVAPGPTVALFEKRYIFPSYTRLPVQIIQDHTGAVHGLAGSGVQLILHTTEPLAVGSRVVINPQASHPETLPLVRYGPLAYLATLRLAHNAAYAVMLVNRRGIQGPTRVWPVTVVPIPPPTIHIMSPALTVRVRPQDHVPVQFTATDPYGISAIRVLIWTQPSAVRTLDIAVPGLPRKVIHSSWTLSAPQQLRAADRTHSHAIYYRLEAVDSARPQAHIAMTAPHELILDAHLHHGYAARQDKKLWLSLRQAILRALHAVNAGGAQARVLVHWPTYKEVDPSRKATVAGAAVRLVRAGRALKQQAQTMLATDWGSVAARAIGVVHGPMQTAAEDLARTGLLADQSRPTRLHPLARAGMAAIKQAQASLLRLLHALDQAKAHADLKNSLARLARRQRAIARTLSATGPSRGTYHHQQAVATQLQQLLRQHPSLQSPMAQHLAANINQLAQKVASIVAQQTLEKTDLNPSLRRQAQLAKIAQLAGRQQLLDRQIAQLNQHYKPIIAAAAALHVTAAMMQTVIRALHSAGDAAVVREGRNNIVKTLRAMARQLYQYAQQAKNRDNPQKSHQAQLNQAAADKLIRQVQAAAAFMQQGDSAKALQAAAAAADAIRQQVRNLLNENPTDQEQAHLRQARADVNQAVKQAIRQSGHAGARLLKQSGQQLAKAALEQAQHIEAQVRLAHQAGAAAARAKTLSDRQAALTVQTTAAQQTPTPGAVEDAQHQTATAIGQAIGQERAIEQQAQAGAPDVAHHLATALTHMQNAQTSQGQAAAAQSTHDQAEDQARQNQALAQMRVAGQELAALEHTWKMETSPASQAPGNHGSGQQAPGSGPAGASAAGQTHMAQAGQSAGTGQSSTSGPSGDAGQGGAGSDAAGAMSAVAQNIQKAVAMQRQAMAGSAGAAAAAAQSLTLASASLARQLAARSSALPGENTGPSPTAPPSPPGATMGTGGTGISGPMPDTTPMPPQVTALGISPAQWEQLGPLRQLRLVNIARQKLPFGYRRIIRDYYLRIARLQPHAAPAK